MNIVVLSGGMTPQRDVSGASGANVVSALRALGHRAILIDAAFGIPSLMTPVSAAFSAETKGEARTIGAVPPEPDSLPHERPGEALFPGRNTVPLCKAADMTFLALCCGDGENGRLQAFFDLQGIRYTGPGYEGCLLSSDKLLARQLVRNADIPVPECTFLRESELRDLGDVRLPLIVKPRRGGASVGISVVRDERELASALCEAFRFESDVLLEEYVPGREISVAVLGGRALPAVEVRTEESFFTYSAKYHAAERGIVVPAPVSASQEKLLREYAERAAHVLGTELCCRIDLMLPLDGDPVFLEANANPELTQTSLLFAAAAAEGMDAPALIGRILELSSEKYR